MTSKATMTFASADMETLLAALAFSAHKHRNQRRKDADATPYINHPIEVAELLWRVGGVRDIRILVAALLHDVLEDTLTEPEEIESRFGSEVLSFVCEVTDDKRLPRADRKRLQIEHAPSTSCGAKHIKLADKICNVVDVTHAPPRNWDLQRRQEYLDWTERVVRGLRGCNPTLEAEYDRVLAAGRKRLARAASEKAA